MTATTPKTTEIPFNAFFESGQEEELSPFLKPTSRRWAINLSLKSAIAAAILLAIAFFLHIQDFPHPLVYIFLLFVYFLAGVPSLIEAIEDLFSLQVNIDVLMTLAAFGSVLIGSPFEGGLLLVLFSISGAMEDAVTRKAKASLRSLHHLAPSSALVIEKEGNLIEKAIADIAPETLILIRAGQVVPLDGVIVEGASSVNLVHLTGESLPVTKIIGDSVPSGALNLEGVLTIAVTHISSNSTLSRIIRLVTEAQEAKPQLQRWFDSVSGLYAKLIILSSFFFAMTLPFLTSISFLGTEGSIYRSLAFLIAASPCALIIAIPIAYLSAIGACARRGVMLKGGITLDALASCTTIAFDKTGTLTSGELEFLGISAHQKSSQLTLEEAFDLTLTLEQNAVHPIAQAITSQGIALNRKTLQISSFKLIPGYGLEADYKGKKVLLGNYDLISSSFKNSEDEFEKTILKFRQSGEILAFLSYGEEIFILRFADKIREGIHKTIRELKQEGYHLLMLTGDHPANAKRVAKELSIDRVEANLKPEDKLKIVAEVAHLSGLVMVGDGVNDAPALARATVGISMGKIGSSAAIEAADVVLLQDSIEHLGWLMHKAKKTQRIVNQNLIIATAAIILASFPALAGLVPLWLAVIIHEGGTLIVGLNGLRLLK